MWEPYFINYETHISKNWQRILDTNKIIPKHFQMVAKGVVSFRLDQNGYISKIKILHSAKETHIFAAHNLYGTRANLILEAMDYSMMQAIKESIPLIKPSKFLNCPRDFACVFDAQQDLKVHLLVNDHINSPY